MLTTTNYLLKKPELTDSPPDITVTNPNWDTIDTELFRRAKVDQNGLVDAGALRGSPTLMQIQSTDFISTAIEQHGFLTGAAINGGSISATGSDANHIGQVRCSSSTIANSGYVWGSSSSGGVALNGGEVLESVFYLENITNETIKFGFNISAPAYGAWIEITGTTLVGKTANNGSVATTPSTSINYGFYRIKVEVNSDASAVIFTLYNSNGTQIWQQTLTTNLPPKSLSIPIIASATSSGTTTVALIDWDLITFSCSRKLIR
jgi:hypothetical protein